MMKEYRSDLNHFYKKKYRIQKILIHVYIVITCTILVIQGCKKESNIDEDQNNELIQFPITDSIDNNLNDLLYSIPSDTTIKITELKFDDGSSILDFLKIYEPSFLNDFPVFRSEKVRTTRVYSSEEQHRLLISKMQIVAFNLTTRSFYKNYKNSDQPNGLAYSWGSKGITNKIKPANYNNKPNICQSALYGLDCSGMIYVMAKNANLNIASSAACCRNHPSHIYGPCATFMLDTANWNKLLRNSSVYQDLKARRYRATGVSLNDPSYINKSMLKFGDLIFKTDKNCNAIHVGMVLNTNYVRTPQTLSIFQSNGSPDKGCDVNKSEKCGPRIITLESKEFGKLYGIDWQVIRFESKYEIGDAAFGGIITGLDPMGFHGFVTSKFDISDGVNPDGTVDWSTAKQLCRNWTVNGFFDWTLPTESQLLQMYIQQNKIGNFSTSCVDFRNCTYWSSTPTPDQKFISALYFTNGTFWSNYVPTAQARVRPVRLF